MTRVKEFSWTFEPCSVRARRRAGVANQLVRLLENVGIGRLLAGKERECDKGRAEHQADQHHPAVRPLVGGVE
jgi:hypothetical protein